MDKEICQGFIYTGAQRPGVGSDNECFVVGLEHVLDETEEVFASEGQFTGFDEQFQVSIELYIGMSGWLSGGGWLSFICHVTRPTLTCSGLQWGFLSGRLELVG